MNHSVENVTLYAVFIQDVLRNYEDKQEEYAELFAMTAGYPIDEPFAKVPMKLYNDMCTWIEVNLGRFNLIRIGRNIGETVHQNLVAQDLIQQATEPLGVMQCLVIAASQMIQDPEGRGWEIVSHDSKSIVMRRTQTFNSILQLGLLDGLIRKTGVSGVKVDYIKKETEGAEFDEYLITWLK
ncbi:MAG: hypothetical protein JJT94_00435 [Bernardetiaceae bacterium]|nr:hypothetical protein [Bernardetiaceae bacterium]